MALTLPKREASEVASSPGKLSRVATHLRTFFSKIKYIMWEQQIQVETMESQQSMSKSPPPVSDEGAKHQQPGTCSSQEREERERPMVAQFLRPEEQEQIMTCQLFEAENHEQTTRCQLLAKGFTPEETARLRWLRKYYQNGGSERMEVVRSFLFLRYLLAEKKLEP